jgi:hypothetical protein
MTLVAVGEPVQVDKMDKPGAKTDQAFNKENPKFVSETRTINARTPVGEIGTLITNGRGTDCDGLDSTSGRVIACIMVVVASSDGKVHTSIDRSVNGIVESLTLATTVRESQWWFEVGDGPVTYPRLMLATDPLCAV